ncbi:hypothetical protein [Streptomyces sp. NPDC058572]|uniref:hypothetical protein n=1 Tax=Streptomyces sp. NPDC058572 TaxID=3346546 RepID=UPI00364B8422
MRRPVPYTARDIPGNQAAQVAAVTLGRIEVNAVLCYLALCPAIHHGHWST